ncbi:MAG: 2-oxoacid:acceptor oxidoreductase subunit alpha [Gammaproteobacteria bacterium]|nr:MAG: 2-oxoacid:acceptor oxidoreductase subunit alpha [Gammaproteobacteria bacterium]
MRRIDSVNDFVIKFANVNGTGSASANNMFAKAVFRMGVPVSPKNIFPSNIQGLPTWYEVRVNEKGYLGRRGGVDFMVCVNPQSMAKDVQEVLPGGYFLYDNTKQLDLRYVRQDVNYIGIPLTDICLREYTDPRKRQLFKNIIYVGALASLFKMDFAVLKNLVSDQFEGKEKLIAPNIHALELGYQYVETHYPDVCGIRVETRDNVGDRILLDGNTATGLGAVYGGATVAAWYPITPSTSVVEGFEKYAGRLRIDPATGRKNFAIIQAEDELAAIGMVIGAAWNGARSFTATSGPGVSLMNEFLGLAYFAEVPAVLIDVQRTGPSTGMPTRTQQSDILISAYASHGDTKHVLLIPSTPHECFTMTADAFDLAERLQTPVIMLTDLDLGMNDHMTEALSWDDSRQYDRGKVYTAEDLDRIGRFGRYLDSDGDGIPYRTYPGTHPTKGSFFTRGTSRDEYAAYTEDGTVYARNMDRLLKKWDTAKTLVPAPVLHQDRNDSKYGIIFYGTSQFSVLEACDGLLEEGIALDAMRIRSFPFSNTVRDFIDSHEAVFVVEQNRDGQMRTLLINELGLSPDRLIPVLNYDGMPITATWVKSKVRERFPGHNVTTLHAKAGESIE